MMASSTPTIIDLKIAFLRSQILLLSQPLRPSSTFTASNTTADENSLRQRTIDDALRKLNNQLKQHNKLAYGPQARRHVAEQVDMLYWNAGERGLRAGEDWAERGADYRHESLIEQLPEEWSEEASARATEQASKYAELQQRLAALNEQRKVARERLNRYKKLKELVELLGEDGGVQENLVTRNGEVEVELEKMRRLMLRVERGVGALEERDGEEEMDLDGRDEEARILALLDV